MKKTILLLAAIVMTAVGVNAQVIVNSNETHSVVHGRGRVKTIVNSDGSHSIVHGSTIANSNGTHSTIHGKLPMKAEEFIGRHFANGTISVATVNSMFLRTTYDVVFTDGRSVEFNSNGKWKAVSDVPEEIVPDAILRHIAANHPGDRVREISRGRRKWDVRLDNSLELKFDRQFHPIANLQFRSNAKVANPRKVGVNGRIHHTKVRNNLPSTRIWCGCPDFLHVFSLAMSNLACAFLLPCSFYEDVITNQNHFSRTRSDELRGVKTELVAMERKIEASLNPISNSVGISGDIPKENTGAQSLQAPERAQSAESLRVPERFQTPDRSQSVERLPSTNLLQPWERSQADQSVQTPERPQATRDSFEERIVAARPSHGVASPSEKKGFKI